MIPASLYDNSASSSAISYENAASPEDVQSTAVKSSLRGGDEEEEDGVMETILEDSSMDFVWVSETTATTISEGEEEEVEEEPSNNDQTMSQAISSSLNQEFSSSSTSSIFGWGHRDSDTTLLSQVWDRTRDYCTSYYKSAFSSSSSTSTSTSSLSTSRPRQQQHRRGMLPRKSRIHESYDWVSNVQIEGGQLILPGQLIVLDDGNYGNISSSSTTASATTQNCYHNIDEDGGSLGNSNGLSSTTTKSTIMVSAHDLLATTTKKSSQGDDEYDLTTNNNTTSSSTSRFSKAIWKFTKHTTKKAARYVQRPVLSTSTYLSTRLRRIEERYHLVGSTMGWVSGTILGDCDGVDDDVDDGNNGDDDDATTKGPSTINIELTPIAQPTSPRPTDFNTLN